jgi:hypothetical protein
MSDSSTWERQAEQVMFTVMSHPGALPFMIPPVIGNDFPEDYFRIITSPIDLRTISLSLASHKYKTVNDWRRSVDLVFDNTVRYYRNGPIVKLGETIRAIFEKSYAKEFESLTQQSWFAKVQKLRNQLGGLCSAPPQIPLCDITFEKKLSSQLPTDNELKAFLEVAAKLKKPEDHEKLLELLKREEPEISFGTGKVSIDLISLKPSTIRLAQKFIKERLATQGITE